MTDEQLFRDVAMRMVLERAKDLAIRRTYIHSENENRSHKQKEERNPHDRADDARSISGSL